MWLVMIILAFVFSSWLSDGQFCRVVDDSENFVECACTHLSVYTAYAETGSFASFNEAFYAAGFICISGNVLSTCLSGYKTHRDVTKKSCIACVLKTYSTVYTCLSPAGFALAIVSHMLCSRFLMFAAKLLTHMMMACLGTQVRPNFYSNLDCQIYQFRW